MNNHPDYAQLESISDFLEDFVPNYPENKCQMVTRFLNLVMNYKEIAGMYVGKIYGDETHHAWSLDESTNLYIDLTIRQFDKSHKRITILPVNTSLLIPKESFTNSHLKATNTELWGNYFEALTVEDIANIYKNNYKIPQN